MFLNFVTVGTRGGYSLLQRCLPVFLAATSTDPGVWIERNGLLLVSIPHALDSPRVEIKRFVFYDIMIAFALGIPPLVQYDTSDVPVISAAPGPMDWVHGIPMEFTVGIVEVNTWRASIPGIPNMNDWLDLELRALAWTPSAMELGGGDSYEIVARLAVQECWRNAILIYIYMVNLTPVSLTISIVKQMIYFDLKGMCGVDSHDSRVQYSARQIVQLMDTISASPLDVHLFVPSLTVSIYARPFTLVLIFTSRILISGRDSCPLRTSTSGGTKQARFIPWNSRMAPSWDRVYSGPRPPLARRSSRWRPCNVG